MNLIPLHPDHVGLLASGDFRTLDTPDGRAPANIAAVAPTLVEIAKAYADLYGRDQAAAPWIGYLAISGSSLVGTCGFTASPSGGSVEIAYFTFPDFEGLGWGKRMAEALVDLAWRETDVRLVVAHTLRRETASTRILRRLDFQLKGTVIDPDEGAVWRWHLQRKARAA